MRVRKKMGFFKACDCDSYGGICPQCSAKEAKPKCEHGSWLGSCQLCISEINEALGRPTMDELAEMKPGAYQGLFPKTDSALATQIGGEHYKGCKIQPIQFIEANALGFLEGCVVKRVTRHNKPTGKGRQDIEKAIHELQLLLELRYPTASC